MLNLILGGLTLGSVAQKWEDREREKICLD